MAKAGTNDRLFMGVQLKYVSLVTLVVQNSMLMLVVRYSRTLPPPVYLPSTAVVMSELTKLLVCIYIHVSSVQNTSTLLPVASPASSPSQPNHNGNISSTVVRLYNDVFGPGSEWVKMMIPAVLYLIQNNLQYIALSLLDAATVQVTYQLKILTTALFSVWMLNKQLSAVKWTSLVLLSIGVAIVQLPPSYFKEFGTSQNLNGSVQSKGGAENLMSMDRFFGFVAILAASLLSGLAGVYFEKVLKGTSASVWLRNIQLSFFSLVPGLVFGVYYLDREVVDKSGFFTGYTIWTWAAIACQALGGLLVAVVVKYADNILKGFATSISIILSCLVSYWLFNFELTVAFVVGSAAVLYATHLYGKSDCFLLLNL
ncbi:nucleotide-sugar transporter-domain-containing protein [Cladochytrium replicatum]|nr:nucleotide-sugar transporter-domain-containing protein [Cladochytrium replicatum]